MGGGQLSIRESVIETVAGETVPRDGLRERFFDSMSGEI
jgi:hypothetical protein